MEITYDLVVPGEAPSADDNLSVFAPLGAALIGLKLGQNIQWQTNRGQQTVEVLAVGDNESILKPTAFASWPTIGQRTLRRKLHSPKSAIASRREY